MSIQTIFGNELYNWININTDKANNLEDIYATYDIDEEVIAYSLDRNERAHFEYDQKTDTFVVVFNVPDQRKIDNHYETIPMVYIIKDKQLLTITNKNNQYIVKKMNKYLKENEDVTILQFLFSSIYCYGFVFSVCGRDGY